MLFVGHRSFDGLSFAANAPIRSIFCCDGGETITQAQEEFGITIHSLEAHTGIREAWTSAHIDRLVATLPPESDKIVAYSSSRQLETMAAQRTISGLFANRDRLKRFFDNKLVSKNIFKRLGLQTPKAKAFHFSEIALAHAIETLGTPLVVRKLFSSTGAGTFLISDITHAYEQLLFLGIQPGETLVVEQFAEGIPININACIVGDEIYVYAPSIQLIGIAECTELPFGFCGNDYIQAQTLPSSVLQESVRQTRLVGAQLNRAGYKGIFGIDLIVTSQGTVMPCEINPRFQNSTSLLNWAYKAPPCSPASLHLAAFGQHSAKLDTQLPPPAFSQIILHADSDAVVKGSLAEGRYRIDAHGIPRLVEKTLNPLLLQSGEFLLCGSPPIQNTLVKAGASLFKIVTQTAVTATGFALNPSPVSSAIAALKARLQLEPPQAIT